MKNAFLLCTIATTLIASLHLSGCTQSSSDATSPSARSICFDLEIESLDVCGLKFSMSIVPSCAAVDSGFASSYRARHDFDNDGQWDTGFWSLTTHPIFDQITLPSDVWLVKSEVQRADSSTFIVESSLDLPEWLPVPPDIIAAQCGLSDAPVETLLVDQSWTFYARAVHWMNTGTGQALVRYYIDGEVFHEGYVGYYNPLDAGCNFTGKSHPGFSEPGTHELKVVWDVEDVFAETNEDNNEITKSLVVLPK